MTTCWVSVGERRTQSSELKLSAKVFALKCPVVLFADVGIHLSAIIIYPKAWTMFIDTIPKLVNVKRLSCTCWHHQFT